jgi:predicted ATPase
MTPVRPAEPKERAAELDRLSALLATAAGGRGQLCIVDGASGVGKSRLLDESAGIAAARGMNVVRARGSELAREYPFGVVRQLFEARVIRAEAATRAALMRGPATLAEPVFGHG